MKKLIYILFLLPFFAIGQVSNGTEFEQEAFRATNNQTVTTSDFITTTGTDGTQGKILCENISLSVIPPVTHFAPLTPNIKGYFQGVDNALGDIVATTAGVTTRLWLTADQTTITAGTFYRTNFVNKGVVASAEQSVINDDNQKKYFTQDIIGDAYVAITTFPKGVYAGNLSVSTSPNSAQQRFTVEVYKCNNAGTPIASGISGAVTGDLGVTVITILDSGLLTLADGSVTNVPVSNTIEFPFTVNVGERVRYHISAEKVGTAASNITEKLYLGTSYNSYIDVPVPLNTSSVQNLSTVAGATTTDALNTLNTSLTNDVIRNQTASLQTANFRISGTNSFFGTTNFYNSASSAFPVNFKTPAGSMNIDTAINDDINLITSGSGMTTIQGGWGLGFKPVPALEAGPDFGTTVGGIAYRPPTESMTKNFFIFRGGQYVFEDEGASWKMIITPTGVNIGGGATLAGGAIPMNNFEVHGNTVIGASYDRAFSAPTNGLLVEGNTAIGTSTAIGKFSVFTGTGLTLDQVGQLDKSIVMSNGSSGVFAPYISGKSSNGIGLVLAGINEDVNPVTDVQFRSIRNSSNTDYTTLTTSAFRFVRHTTTLLDILRNGNTTFTGTVKASPATLSTELVTLGQIGAVPKKYTALISQSGTSAPTVTVLENTLGGTVVWTRSGAGAFTGTLSGAFTSNKTVMWISNTAGAIASFPAYIAGNTTGSVNSVTFGTYIGSNPPVSTDGLITNASIEIRVYL